MQLWNWRTWEGKAFLTCELIPLPHGFFTRLFYPAAPDELVDALLPTAQVFRVKQVHSADVLLPSEIESQTSGGLPMMTDGVRAPFPLADGVLTEHSGQSGWACSADCTPALICDVATRQGAAVHAGWRGTAQKILPAAIARMIQQGSALKNLRVALGPAIEGAVYQVGEEVAVEVGRTIASAKLLTPEELLEELLNIEEPPLLSDPNQRKVRLDVRRINKMQMIQMGLADEQIAIAPHCTYQEPEKFFSYRRTHEKKVQWAGIVSQ